jgi:gas vesicle protein
MVSNNPTNVPNYGSSTGVQSHSAASAVQNLRDKASERVRDVTGYVSEKTSKVSREVQHRASQAKDWFEQTVDEYPIAMGAAFVVLGVAAGLAIPTTAPERRVVGKAGRRLAEQAQEMGSQLIDKGEQLAESAVETVRSSIRSTGSHGGSNRPNEGQPSNRPSGSAATSKPSNAGTPGKTGGEGSRFGRSE